MDYNDIGLDTLRSRDMVELGMISIPRRGLEQDQRFLGLVSARLIAAFCTIFGCEEDINRGLIYLKDFKVGFVDD